MKKRKGRKITSRTIVKGKKDWVLIRLLPGWGYVVPDEIKVFEHLAELLRSITRSHPIACKKAQRTPVKWNDKKATIVAVRPGTLILPPHEFKDFVKMSHLMCKYFPGNKPCKNTK